MCKTLAGVLQLANSLAQQKMVLIKCIAMFNNPPAQLLPLATVSVGEHNPTHFEVDIGIGHLEVTPKVTMHHGQPLGSLRAAMSSTAWWT